MAVPKIFIWRGYKFFFFSNEGKPRELCHIHVRKGSGIAKFWVDPAVSLDSAYEISPRELNRIQEVVEEKADLIRRKWDEYFSD